MKDGRKRDRWCNQAGVTLLELTIAIAVLAVITAGLLAVFSTAVGQNKSQGEIATRTTEYCQDKMEQLMSLQFSDSTSDTTTMAWSPVTYSSSYATWSSATTYSSGSNVNFNGTSYLSNISSNLNYVPGLTPWSPVTYSSTYAAWSSTTTYSAGSYVNYNSTAQSYESNISSNLNYVPGVTSFPHGGTGLGGTAASTTYPPGGSTISSPVAGYVDYLSVAGSLLGGGSPAPSGAFYVRVWQIQTDSTGNLKTITVTASTLSTAGFGGVAPTSTLVCLKANF